MTSSSPVAFGLAGLGGWAGAICQLLQAHSGIPAAAPGSTPPSMTPTPGTENLIRLAAVVEPDHKLHAAKIAELRAHGVKVFERYDDLLGEPIEALWLPLPIQLHRSYTERALAAGKAVMCEKPIAGAVDDVDAMIAARDKAKLPVLVGYPDVYDTTTLPAKRRLIEGAIGTIRRASVYACWPRHDSYYARTNWAGALKRDGVWVLDSPANNALAHNLNIPLFLMGASNDASANPVEVEAELYRVYPIENYDTISLRMKLDTGATLLVHFTHACEKLAHPELIIEGDKGTLRRTNDRLELRVGGQLTTFERKDQTLPAELRQFAAVVRGKRLQDLGISTLESARAQTLAVNGASEAVAVTALPESTCRIIDTEFGKLRTIPGIEDAFAACTLAGKMLHESGLAKWARPAGRRDMRGYKHFGGPKGA